MKRICARQCHEPVYTIEIPAGEILLDPSVGCVAGLYHQCSAVLAVVQGDGTALQFALRMRSDICLREEIISGQIQVVSCDSMVKGRTLKFLAPSVGGREIQWTDLPELIDHEWLTDLDADGDHRIRLEWVKVKSVFKPKPRPGAEDRETDQLDGFTTVDIAGVRPVSTTLECDCQAYWQEVPKPTRIKVRFVRGQFKD